MNLFRLKKIACTAAIVTLGVLTPFVLESVSKEIEIAQAGVSGTYSGLKLPWTAGLEKRVTRVTSHGSGRHAVDFGLNFENVLAMKGGRVELYPRVNSYDTTGGGYALAIDHGDGYCSIYLHLNTFYVANGTTVSQGQLIAQSGNSGSSSTGAHLHASVIQKERSGSCSWQGSREIEMRFDELPSRELRSGDSLKSQNGSSSGGGGSSTNFVSGSSTASITTSAVNLTVRASNLSGKRVYVQMWRDRVGSYAERTWSSSTIASGSSVTFNDLDGTGNTLQGVNYYIVASLEPIRGGTAAQRRTSCYSATGGKQLCDRVRR